MSYTKRDKINKYASNITNDYFRLQIIDNFRGKEQELTDKLMVDLADFAYDVYLKSSSSFSPGDIAYAICMFHSTNQEYTYKDVENFILLSMDV